MSTQHSKSRNRRRQMRRLKKRQETRAIVAGLKEAAAAVPAAKPA